MKVVSQGTGLGPETGPNPPVLPRCPEPVSVREEVLEERGAQVLLDSGRSGENPRAKPAKPLGNGAGQPKVPVAVLFEDSHLEGGEKVAGDCLLGHFGFPGSGGYLNTGPGVGQVIERAASSPRRPSTRLRRGPAGRRSRTGKRKEGTGRGPRASRAGRTARPGTAPGRRRAPARFRPRRSSR